MPTVTETLILIKAGLAVEELFKVSALHDSQLFDKDGRFHHFFEVILLSIRCNVVALISLY